MTIVAAWIKAETGVGPSIASGSQVWSGSCADFATAPPRRPSATRFRTVVRERRRAPRTTTPKSSDPVFWISRKNASAIVASPNAFMMNAFLAAATALGRSWWKPISRYDESPTRPQPISRKSRFPPWTSISIDQTNSDMYAKYRRSSSSPSM